MLSWPRFRGHQVRPVQASHGINKGSGVIIDFITASEWNWGSSLVLCITGLPWYGFTMRLIVELGGI